MATFPSTLPSPNRDGYLEGEIDTRESEPNNIGVFNQRQMAPGVYKTWSYSYDLSTADEDVLLTFHDTTVKHVEIFTFVCPRRGTSHDAVFTERPKLTAFLASGYAQWSVRIVEV